MKELALVVTVASLFLGAALPWLGRATPGRRAFLDGLTLVLITGLCLIHLAPHALLHAGPWALVGLVVGVLLPTLIHRLQSRAYVWIFWVLLAGHSALDGVALAAPDPAVGLTLTLAVIAHQLPFGLVMAENARRRHLSMKSLVFSVLGLAGAMVVGFVGATHMIPASDVAHGVLEALVAGGLLHVVFAPHMPVVQVSPTLIAPASPLRIQAVAPTLSVMSMPALITPASCGHVGCQEHTASAGKNDAKAGKDHRWSAGGALIGLLLIGGFTLTAAQRDGVLSHVEETTETLLTLTIESAPALLLGFLLAGLLSSVLDPARAAWLSGGGQVGQALRGVVFGLPLPICSCGVVPLYRSLIRQGVPATAAMAFLVATPELGLDAVLLSVPLLGGPMAAARVGAAFVVALLVGLLVGRMVPRQPPSTSVTSASPLMPWRERLQRGVRYGTQDLVDHTLPWILVGLVIAALAEPLLRHDVLLSLPSVLQVPLAALIGVPLYVCAAGATPLAAMAIHKGLSGGAALAFLLAGPATNMTTFGILSALHGRRVAISFGLILSLLAIILGWTVDGLGIEVHNGLHTQSTSHTGAVVGWICAGLVALLGIRSLFRQGPRGMLMQVLQPTHSHG